MATEAATLLRQPRFDLGTRPFLVLFELTRACDLACRHCRATSVPDRDPAELTTEEAYALFDDLASLGAPRPVVVLTGGDPFKRPDLAPLVLRGNELGLRMAVAPSGTPLATRANLTALRAAGATAVSFSIDAASEATHDAFRGVEGSFAWTVGACQAAREVGLRLQINTTVTTSTVWQLPDMVGLVRALGASLWSVFFVVPTGRAGAHERLSASKTEDVLHFLYDAATVVPLKTTEAPQYRRVLVEQAAAPPGATRADRGFLYQSLHARLEELLAAGAAGDSEPAHGPDAFVAPRGQEHPSVASRRRPPLAVGDGRGVVFVSHRGEVSPSGFLPLVAGNIREVPLTQIYRRAPLLQSLRDPDQLGGRCGRCEFRDVCGGSRAQAYAASGDPLAEDPTCPYEP